MAKLEHGSVKITLSDDLKLPEKAGRISPDELRRIPRAPRDIGRACEDAAELVDKSGAALSLPADVTADALRMAAHRADGIDRVIADVEYLLATLKQANLLFDAEAWELLRKLHAMVKSQAQFDPEVATRFAPLFSYFSQRAGSGGANARPAEPAQPAPEEPVA